MTISSSARGVAWQYRTPSISTVSGRSPSGRAASAPISSMVSLAVKRAGSSGEGSGPSIASATSRSPLPRTQRVSNSARRSSVARANGPGTTSPPTRTTSAPAARGSASTASSASMLPWMSYSARTFTRRSLSQLNGCVSGRASDAVWMPSVYLIGGGRGEDALRASHAPFVHAVGDQAIVALVLDEGDDTDVDRWTGALTTSGAAEVRAVVVSKDRPPTAEDVEGAGGVFVAGGWTPGYQEALVAAGTDWLPRDVPFAGFSAGAAIAGEWAIVGGWRHAGKDICAEEAGEDLEPLTRPPRARARPVRGRRPRDPVGHGHPPHPHGPRRPRPRGLGGRRRHGAGLRRRPRRPRRGPRLRLSRERVGRRPAPRGGESRARRAVAAADWRRPVELAATDDLGDLLDVLAGTRQIFAANRVVRVTDARRNHVRHGHRRP